MSRRAPRAALLLLVLAAAGLAAIGPAEAQQDGKVLARAFEVRHRPLADAADVVGPLLSSEGSVTLRPRLRMLVVQDRPEVLDRVEALLAGFDLPPRHVEVTFSLFLGSDRRPDAHGAAGGSQLSQDVRGVLETLGDFTKWTAYEPLGSRSVAGVEGNEVVAALSPEYRVVFVVESVDDGTGVVSFRQLTLQRMARDAAGVQQIENMYSTGMVLRTGRLHVVGAASGPQSNRALFLTLQVEAR